MGVMLVPRFDRKLRGAEFNAEGKFLANALDALDELAARAGVPPLSSFGDFPQVPAEVRQDLGRRPGESNESLIARSQEIARRLDAMMEEAEAELRRRPERWFPAADGVASVTGLLATLAHDPEPRPPALRARGLKEALEELHRCLGVAAKARARFRLEMF